MLHQLVLAASSAADSPITAWDLATGTQLAQFKGNSSARNCVCCCGRDYLIGAQSGKDALHFWTWHKDAVLQRSFVQERATAVAASASGTHVAAGGASGALYLWEAPSGRLLRTWPAHYKGVSALVFLDGGNILVSGGEDTLVQVWPLAAVADAELGADAGHLRVEPLHSWSEHTLPVTALGAGAGEVTAVVVSASLDRSVKLWDVARGQLLRSVALPAALLSLALGAGEHVLYAGGADGSVFEVALTQEAAGAGGGEAYVRLEGHGGLVGSLALSLDGEALVSGSEDGTARVWDQRSRQCVRVLAAPAKAPITAVLVVEWPPHLPAGAQAAAGAAGRVGPCRMQPLAPLAKYPGTAGSLAPWEGPPVILAGSLPSPGGALTPGAALLSGACMERPLLALQHALAAQGAQDAGAAGWFPGSDPFALALGDGYLAPAAVDQEDDGHANANGHPHNEPQEQQEEEVAVLRRELAAAREQAAAWQALHGELHAFCVRSVVAGPGMDGATDAVAAVANAVDRRA